MSGLRHPPRVPFLRQFKRNSEWTNGTILLQTNKDQRIRSIFWEVWNSSPKGVILEIHSYDFTSLCRRMSFRRRTISLLYITSHGQTIISNHVVSNYFVIIVPFNLRLNIVFGFTVGQHMGWWWGVFLFIIMYNMMIYFTFNIRSIIGTFCCCRMNNFDHPCIAHNCQ